MDLHDLVFAFVAFASEVVGTLSGFGASTFFVPVAVRLESFQLVLVLTAILHCFGNTSKIFLFRSQFNWKFFYWLAIPSFAFAGIGAVLTEVMPVQLLQKGLGGALIATSGVYLVGGIRFQRAPKWVTAGLCALSGFMTGLVGTGGAIRGVALASLRLSHGAFVALSSGIDLGGDLLRLVIYLKNGFMEWDHWFYIPLLGLAAYAGARVGKYLLSFISHRQFERVVAVFVLLSGIAMLI